MALPPMLMLTPDVPAVNALVLRRRARLSGQRSLPSVVEPRPSVIESPSVTTALLALSASTSMPVMMYQCAIFDMDGELATETRLPEWMNDVVREPGCP